MSPSQGTEGWHDVDPEHALTTELGQGSKANEMPDAKDLLPEKKLGAALETPKNQTGKTRWILLLVLVFGLAAFDKIKSLSDLAKSKEALAAKAQELDELRQQLRAQVPAKAQPKNPQPQAGNGIIEGHPDGQFRPPGKINFGQPEERKDIGFEPLNLNRLFRDLPDNEREEILRGLEMLRNPPLHKPFILKDLPDEKFLKD